MLTGDLTQEYDFEDLNGSTHDICSISVLLKALSLELDLLVDSKLQSGTTFSNAFQIKQILDCIKTIMYLLVY